MQLQHNSPDPADQEHNSFAAVQHKFPEATVHHGQIG
jgi:protein required for attachment to host cells